MPSWRRSCVYARGAAARAVFWRGAAMLGVWAMIRRGFGARGARLVHALALFALSNQRARLQPSIEIPSAVPAAPPVISSGIAGSSIKASGTAPRV